MIPVSDGWWHAVLRFYIFFKAQWLSRFRRSRKVVYVRMTNLRQVPIADSGREIDDHLEWDHNNIERLFDQLQTQVDNRDALLHCLVQGVLGHFAALSSILPDLARRIVYPSLMPQLQTCEAETRLLLAELDRIAPESLEFDAVLQKVVDKVMDQIDLEIRILLPAIAVVLSLGQRIGLGLAWENAQRGYRCACPDSSVVHHSANLVSLIPSPAEVFPVQSGSV